MNEHSLRTASADAVPVVVDLDGTLLRTDLLLESFLSLASSYPLKALKSIVSLVRGKAAFKAKVADEAIVDVGSLPLNPEVVNFIKTERERGRPIFLASASDRRYVEAVAAHLGWFDGVFGSQHGVNLSGARKAEALCQAFGERGFDYVGDAKVDLDVWARCRVALVAARSRGLEKRVRALAPQTRSLAPPPRRLSAYLKALRPHQWLKNVLIFAPVLAIHARDARLAQSVVAFGSFSLCASSVYLLNDLLDLRSDRQHRRKRRRPFASGEAQLVHGAVLAPLLLAAAVVLGLALPGPFLPVLAGYYVLTMAYSFWLKRFVMVDVMALACLYGARMIAGSAATGISVSPWLGALAIFLFLSLALVKRCTELGDHASAGEAGLAGRGYRAADLPLLQSMAVASGYLTVLVLALYLNSEAVVRLYKHPVRLWGLCLLVLFWINRILIKTNRGEMHDDPVVFAVTDRVSLICGLLAAGVVGAAMV